MNEKFSFNMGVRFAASPDTSENFQHILFEVLQKCWD